MRCEPSRPDPTGPPARFRGPDSVGPGSRPGAALGPLPAAPQGYLWDPPVVRPRPRVPPCDPPRTRPPADFVPPDRPPLPIACCARPWSVARWRSLSLPWALAAPRDEWNFSTPRPRPVATMKPSLQATAGDVSPRRATGHHLDGSPSRRVTIMMDHDPTARDGSKRQHTRRVRHRGLETTNSDPDSAAADRWVSAPASPPERSSPRPGLPPRRIPRAHRRPPASDQVATRTATLGCEGIRVVARASGLVHAAQQPQEGLGRG